MRPNHEELAAAAIERALQRAALDVLVTYDQVDPYLRALGVDPGSLDRHLAALLRAHELQGVLEREEIHLWAGLGAWCRTHWNDLAQAVRRARSFVDGERIDAAVLAAGLCTLRLAPPLASRSAEPEEGEIPLVAPIYAWCPVRHLLVPAPEGFAITEPFRFERRGNALQLVGSIEAPDARHAGATFLLSLLVPLTFSRGRIEERRLGFDASFRVRGDAARPRAELREVLGTNVDVLPGPIDPARLLPCVFPAENAGRKSATRPSSNAATPKDGGIR